MSGGSSGERSQISAGSEQQYYNPGTGQFWNVDPTSGGTGSPGALNRYAYAQGDPISLSDPRGLDATCGPNMQFDGEGCISSPSSHGNVNGPCGPGWMTDAEFAGPCQNPCGGSGEDFMDSAPTPSPACSVPLSPVATSNVITCDLQLFVQPAGNNLDPYLHTYIGLITAVNGISLPETFYEAAQSIRPQAS
jgi:RHS repeat-associated protein